MEKGTGKGQGRGEGKEKENIVRDPRGGEGGRRIFVA